MELVRNRDLLLQPVYLETIIWSTKQLNTAHQSSVTALHSPLDSVLNDTLRIVTGSCVPLQRTIYPYFLASSQLSLADWERHLLFLQFHGRDHMLHGLLSGFSDACQEKLSSRRPFVAIARNLSNNLVVLGISAFHWKHYRWKTD